MVMRKSPTYVGLNANQYVRVADSDSGEILTQGFRSWYGWGPGGKLLEAGGARYMLSTMLGVTVGRGNSVREVIDGLARSARADGTRPDGTFYFVRSDDLRSKPRHDLFDDTVKALHKEGFKAQTVHGVVPKNKDDVAGLMTGAATVKWPDSGSTILPGAVCEHLTSLGGVMFEDAGQTPLSEFLRHGAAGASGAVAEPYAMGQKFPLAYLHLHYARGCSLAEAFYQSVSAPYQLLVVGDPLCRPWADFPEITVAGVKPGATVHGPLAVKPRANYPGGGSVDRWLLYVDGRQVATCVRRADRSVSTRAAFRTDFINSRSWPSSTVPSRRKAAASCRSWSTTTTAGSNSRRRRRARSPGTHR